MGKNPYQLTASEKEELREHLARLLQAVKNGLTGRDACQQFLHVPSGRRVRIKCGDPRLENARLILEAADFGGDDDGKA